MDIAQLQQKTYTVKAEENYIERALLCRELLNDAIDYIYERLEKKKPKKATLLELIDSPEVTNYVGDFEIIQSLHYIRIIGMHAIKNSIVRKKEAKLATENIIFFIEFLTDKANNVAGRRKPPYMSEAETRRLYIDLYLQEAGWEVLTEKNAVIPSKAGIEIEVTGTSNPSGLGYCDYVLYGKDAKPLAVVEVKRTSKDPEVGRKQVIEYADCLEAQYGIRPVQYYTNGYVTRVIDEIYSDDRRMMAFHSLKDLELLIRRRERKQITDMHPDPNITNRGYQHIALTKVCERFNSKRRRALLVMATGTGKTRMAISLTEILSRIQNGWVKNVLFLADRITLVHQAKEAFEELLPDQTICELSAKGEKDENARLIFCTYQTMIGYIDAEDKQFSTGRFDLIIIDEAHRSVFNRFGAIFKYFDSLLLGLTATPKDMVHASTYKLFGCEEKQPTDEYTLSEAVKEKYLVGYKINNRASKILRQGVRYGELTDEQRSILEEYFDEDNPPDPNYVIPGSEMYRVLFNEDTCEKVVCELMRDGIYVDEGETIGKTIIFAYNHMHAQQIVDIFYEMFPEFPSDYCQLVDYSIKRADTLVKEFKEKEEFRIAISVDMLDTGVDIPEVVNLVFFKPVRSWIKFHQMIGRGTRLCENLFGPGRNKKEFLIFDYCQNFELFKEKPEAASGTGLVDNSPSKNMFSVQLNMLYSLQKLEYQLDQDLRNYYLTIRAELYNQLVQIKQRSKRIQVREEMPYVDKYIKKEKWESLSKVEVAELTNHIRPLISSGLKGTVEEVRFDLNMYRIQLSLLELKGIGKAKSDVKRVRQICKYLLEKKASVDGVLAKADLLILLRGEEFWEHPNVLVVEKYREELRGIMRYTAYSRKKLVTDIPDEITKSDVEIEETAIDIRSYKEKVIDYLVEHSENPVILKIKNLEPISNDDLDELERVLWHELGTEKDYRKETQQANLAAFVRSLVGLSQEAVNVKFGEYLFGGQFNSQQQEFIRSVINYVRENGDIELQDIVNTEPFSNFDINEMFGTKVQILVSIVHELHDCIAA